MGVKVLEGPDVESLEQAVFRSLGAASACWSTLSRAGTFDASRAKEIGEELVEYINKHYVPKSGG